MKAILITFDRLPVQYLGCYGNRWIETPHFDRLAATSVLFDEHLAENVDPAATSHAWATGGYTFARGEGTKAQGPSMIRWLREQGIATTLIRERGAGEPHGPAADFDISRECSGEEGLDAAPKQTPIAATVDGALPAIEQLSQSKAPGLLWVHARGVPVPWLAPRGYASLYLDIVDEEDDTRESEESEPLPEEAWEDEELDESDEEADRGESDLRLVDFTPEEFDRFLSERASFPPTKTERSKMTAVDRRIMRCLYAGYVTLLDRELGRLLDGIERSFPEGAPLVMVAAARGEQLDDVTALEGPSAALSDDVVHTPLFVRIPEMKNDIGSRRHALVQTVDFAPTLSEWFGQEPAMGTIDGKSLLPLVRNECDAIREAAFLGDNGRTHGIRIPEAYLVVAHDTSASGADGNDHAQLFLKPEDIWEINDIANQSPDLVESLLEKLKAFLAGG